MGSTHVMKKSTSGEVCSLMSCVNFAPESCSRSASVGSFMMPVRYFFVSFASVKRIWFSWISTRLMSLSSIMSMNVL